MTDISKILVYYYDEDGRRLAIAEVDQLPAVGDVVTLWEGCVGRVLRISDGWFTSFGYLYTRIYMLRIPTAL